MIFRINALSTAPLLAIALAVGLAACGAGAGGNPDQNATSSAPDATTGGTGSQDAAAPSAGISCEALLAAELVPFDASGRRIVFTFDHPAGWDVDTSAEGDDVIAMFTGRSLTSGSTGHDIQFQLAQFSEDRKPDLELLRRMGYSEVDTITYGGQPITIMGQTVFELLMYQMYLPVKKGDGSQGHVQVTFQISPASDRCPKERETIFKALLQTFRPNPGTSLTL